MKKRIKILSSTAALASIGMSGGVSASIISSELSKNKSSVVLSSSTKNDSSIELIPAQTNGQNANISTNAGPVTFNGNTITALDWYGNKLWDKDMSQLVPPPTNTNNGKYGGSWKRAWYNWDYNRKQNTLWVLGYPLNSKQTLFGFNADTGEKTHQKDLNNGSLNCRFLTALSSGKVLIYGDSKVDFNGKGLLYDPSTGNVETLTGNSNSVLPDKDGTFTKSTFRWYFYNLIPLATNINLAEVVAFDSGKPTDGDGSSNRATYNVYGLLVDDKLNFIGDKQSNDTFKKPVLLANGVEGFRSTKVTPKRDYFTLLNSQTVSVTYNTVALFNTSDPNNIKISKVKMQNKNLIQTWTVDSNDNLYFKFLNDGTVYRVGGETLKASADNFSPSTYLALDNITNNDTVKKEANNFVIYNVYGYTGQLMMIDSSYKDIIDIYTNNLDKTNSSTTNWGLAIAVTPNKYKNTEGDLKGVLNGTTPLQKAVDFEIEQNTLKTKIPSEITKSDIKLLNGAFFKDDDKKPFVISEISDSLGTFKVTANLYKIPWFADKLPEKAAPKVITYTFDSSSTSKGTAEKINNKVSWKKLNSSTDYDFMNMLPSNVKEEDIKALDPFQPSFQSQVITRNGTQIYPKSTYTIGDTDNKKGTIEVKVKYEYVPMSATYTGNMQTEYTFGKDKIKEKEVISYNANITYNIFSEGQPSEFYFMGANKRSQDNVVQTIKVSDVPELKSLLEAGTLPSSFKNLNDAPDKTNSAFLQFINTTNSKGYPISKMNFNVTPNDKEGTLNIKATMPDNYSPDKKTHTYEIQYTGLNKDVSYSFNFKEPTTISGANKSSILPSSIDEGNIVNDFINYSGFNSNDFKVVLTPDDEKGTLGVQINLSDKYADAIGNSQWFTKYSASYTYTGFMTRETYNSRFNVTFKGDADTSLLKLRNIQANELKTAFGNGKGLTVDKTTYTSLNQLVESLLVATKGSSIPSGWDNENSGVKTEVYVDNNLGLASFYVNIPKDKVTGASSDLNFVVTYSGFVKGNEVQTNDNLSFVSNTMLKNYLLTLPDFNEEKVKYLTPQTFADWVNKDRNVEKLITYKTGQYITKLEAKDYKVTVTPRDIQGNVSITINFGNLDDKRSLSEYSVQYTI